MIEPLKTHVFLKCISMRAMFSTVKKVNACTTVRKVCNIASINLDTFHFEKFQLRIFSESESQMQSSKEPYLAWEP